MNEPRVSICCLAYNQEKFIGQTIEGFLLQKTSFPVEIIVHDDASTDRTGVIINEYSGRNPNKIVGIFQNENQYSKGINPFIKYILPLVTGEYIAFCEGDDYWTDPLKLQKQADFLDCHPEYGMVCTNYSRLIQGTGALRRNSFNILKYRKEVRFEDYLLDMSTIGTATVMIRSSLVRLYLKEIPHDVRETFVVGDTPLWLYAAAKSRIAVMPDETAVYRFLDTSACHFKSPDDHYKFVLRGFELADYFYDMYGKNNPILLSGLRQKRLTASLFHGYRSMNRELATQSFRELKYFRLNLKKRISAWLMVAGSYTKCLNRATGLILRTAKRGTGRT